jgi:hypothetical protein
MPIHQVMQEWIDQLDGLAEQANTNLATAMRMQERGPGDAATISGALIAIASQMTYSNAVAAAAFYMDNRHHIDREDRP